MNFVILNHLGLRILKTHFYFTKYKMNFEKHPLKTHHHKELSPLSNLFRFHKEELFLTSRHQTFFSFLPKANPGDPFSTSRQEIPLGPCSPVLHITTYTSVSPPPLIKACQQRLTFRTNHSNYASIRCTPSSLQQRVHDCMTEADLRPQASEYGCTQVIHDMLICANMDTHK